MCYLYYWSGDKLQHSFPSLQSIKKFYGLTVFTSPSGNTHWVNDSVKVFKNDVQAGTVERDELFVV